MITWVPYFSKHNMMELILQASVDLNLKIIQNLKIVKITKIYFRNKLIFCLQNLNNFSENNLN